MQELFSSAKQLAFKSAVPHSLRDLLAVARVEAVGQGLVERQRVEDDGVVEGAHEAVHLKTSTGTHMQLLEELVQDMRVLKLHSPLNYNFS